jgi:hypothetical protein
MGHWPSQLQSAADGGSRAIRAQEELANFPWRVNVESAQTTIEYTRTNTDETDESPCRVLSHTTKPFLCEAFGKMMPEVLECARELARKAEREALEAAQDAVMPPEIRAMTPVDQDVGAKDAEG